MKQIQGFPSFPRSIASLATKRSVRCDAWRFFAPASAADFMTRLALVAMLALPLVACVNTTSVNANAANTAARLANAAGLELRQHHLDERLSCVNDNETREAAHACYERVDAAWSPLWAVWTQLRAAHDAWTAAIAANSGDLETAAARLASAWCSVRPLASARNVSLPDVGCTTSR